MSTPGGGAPDRELLVGEVRALRSFALTDDGYLLPLTRFGEGEPWRDGINAAVCAQGRTHEVPDENCTCGFYAYGSPRWVEPWMSDEFAHVRAVVAFSGKMRVGTKGIRAGSGRLAAIWVSGRVPASVEAALREHYPGTTVYRSAKRMLREHPLTHLDGYDSPRTSRSLAGALAVEFTQFRTRRILSLVLAILALSPEVFPQPLPLYPVEFAATAVALIVVGNMLHFRHIPARARKTLSIVLTMMPPALILVGAFDQPRFAIYTTAALAVFASGIGETMSPDWGKSKGWGRAHPLADRVGHVQALRRRLGDGEPQLVRTVFAPPMRLTYLRYPTGHVVVVAQDITGGGITTGLDMRLPELARAHRGDVIGVLAGVVQVFPSRVGLGPRAVVGAVSTHGIAREGVPLRARDALEMLGAAEVPVWVPTRLLTAEGVLAGRGRHTTSGVVSLPLLPSPGRVSEAAGAALVYLEFVWRRFVYRAVQEEVAASGLVPFVSTRPDSAPGPAVTPVVVEGLRELFTLPLGPHTAFLGRVLAEVHADLPVMVEAGGFVDASDGSLVALPALAPGSVEGLRLGHAVGVALFGGALNSKTQGQSFSDQWWGFAHAHADAVTYRVGLRGALVGWTEAVVRARA